MCYNMFALKIVIVIKIIVVYVCVVLSVEVESPEMKAIKGKEKEGLKVSQVS